jgi:hypothetical protein
MLMMFVLSIRLRETLVMMRALNMHVKVDDLENQMENIFHMRCHV